MFRGVIYMKKILALILCFALVLSFSAPALAASSSLTFEEELARDLKSLGLFKGVSETDFALGRAPTRIEALVMLVRVLGKEAEALSKGGKHPFLDVPQWADKYVGYAYQNKLTNGISATKFGSTDVASSAMYLTFVLRALGYSDTNGADFTWDNPYTLARETGVLYGNPDTVKFLRADVVLVSYAALEVCTKGTTQTLAEKLIASGAFTAMQYKEHYNLYAFEKQSSSSELTAEQIYAKCSPAVFIVEVYDRSGKPLGTGSGFFINSDGTAVTNYHVIKGAASAKIKLASGNKIYTVEGVYDYNIKNDWAVIKIPGEDFPYLELDESEVVGGATVYAIGSPLGLDNTISQGLISNTNRVLDNVRFIQTSAAISGGSSGGALINKWGKAIGITSAGFPGGENLNLALPISVIKGFKKDRATPLSSIGASGNKALGNYAVSGDSEEEIAFELLKLWVLNNKNYDISGNSAYQQTYAEDGSETMYIISVDESRDTMTFWQSYTYDGQLLLASVTIENGDDQAYCTTAYYHNLHLDVTARGGAFMDKEELKPGMTFYFFENFEGDFDYKYGMAESSPDFWLENLHFVDYLMRSELSEYLVEYELDGVRALGFYEYE